MPPSPPLQPRARPPRPPAVRVALVAGLSCPPWGLLVLLGTYLLASPGEVAADTGLAEQQAYALFTTVLAWSAGVCALLGAGWIAVTVLTYRGRQWARVLLTVVAVIWGTLTVPTLSGQMYGGITTALLAGLQLALLAGAVIPLYTRPARDYFDHPRYFIHQHPAPH